MTEFGGLAGLPRGVAAPEDAPGELSKGWFAAIAAIGMALTSALALPAFAADLSPGGYKDGPAPAVTDWTGFYLGLNGGGGWSEQRLAYNPTTFTGITPQGAFGGGQIGYNWQTKPDFYRFFGPGSFVFGIEADIQGSGYSDHGTDGVSSSFKSDIDYFGTLRGRAGFAVDKTLYYVTGGLAYGGVKSTVKLGATEPSPGSYSVGTTGTGYAFGGGIELMTSRAWSVKLEYQYLNLGQNDPVNPVHGSYYANGGVAKDDTISTMRLGLNYHTGVGYEPLK
jgi:outer membrane immunogenic protein